MDTKVFIYGLCDPRTNELRYVGKAVNVRNRYSLHIHDAKRGVVRYCCNWIKSLLKEGLRPDIFIIEESNTANWDEAERFWIAYFRSIGCRLTNSTDGGESGQMCAEIVKKRSEKRRGTHHTEEAKARMRASLKGRPAHNAGQFILTAPSGQEITIQNLKSFCRENGFLQSAFSNVLSGKSKTHKGWTIRYASSTHKDKSKTKSKKRDASSKHYVLVSPDGQPQTIKNLMNFAKTNGLHYHSLFRVMRGERPHHRGWTCYRP